MASNGKNGHSAKGVTPDPSHAGAGRRGDGKIRVAIVGVGNCASSLVQGRYYYEDAKVDDFVPGLMHVNLGGYHVRDIEFVAAFDIDKNKVGKDLSEAIYTKPNNTFVFQQVPKLGVKVERGMTHDGLGKYLSQIIEKAPGPTADIVSILKEREVDVHQARDEVVLLRVLVVVAALDEAARAVADADDGDPDLAVLAPGGTRPRVGRRDAVAGARASPAVLAVAAHVELRVSWVVGVTGVAADLAWLRTWRIR